MFCESVYFSILWSAREVGGAVSHSQWKQRDSYHLTQTRRDSWKQFCAHAGLDIILNSPPYIPHLSFSEWEREYYATLFFIGIKYHLKGYCNSPQNNIFDIIYTLFKTYMIFFWYSFLALYCLLIIFPSAVAHKFHLFESSQWGSLWLCAFGSDIMFLFCLFTVTHAYSLSLFWSSSQSLNRSYPPVSFYWREQKTENKILLNQWKQGLWAETQTACSSRSC